MELSTVPAALGEAIERAYAIYEQRKFERDVEAAYGEIQEVYHWACERSTPGGEWFPELTLCEQIYDVAQAFIARYGDDA